MTALAPRPYRSAAPPLTLIFPWISSTTPKLADTSVCPLAPSTPTGAAARRTQLRHVSAETRGSALSQPTHLALMADGHCLHRPPPGIKMDGRRPHRTPPASPASPAAVNGRRLCPPVDGAVQVTWHLPEPASSPPGRWLPSVACHVAPPYPQPPRRRSNDDCHLGFLGKPRHGLSPPIKGAPSTPAPHLHLSPPPANHPKLPIKPKRPSSPTPAASATAIPRMVPSQPQPPHHQIFHH